MVKAVTDYYGIAYPDPVCIDSDAISLLRIVGKRSSDIVTISLYEGNYPFTVRVEGANVIKVAATLGEAAIRCAYAMIGEGGNNER